jgi:hypothetical protein
VDRLHYLYDIVSSMRIVSVTICLILASFLGACAEEKMPVSVGEFMENPRLLEATMVRCSQNRSQMKYESECVNARDAINRLERAEERERRASLEAQSERKRKALRATQEAAAAARRRAEEDQRRREEEEYLGIFDPTPTGETSTAPDPGHGVAPANPVSPPVESQVDSQIQPQSMEPAAEVAPPVEASPPLPQSDGDAIPQSDLDAIREELRRRQQTTE